jgi:hypothetical protein
VITESKKDFFAMNLLNPPCSASPILPCGGIHFVEQGKGGAFGGRGLGCIK